MKPFLFLVPLGLALWLAGCDSEHPTAPESTASTGALSAGQATVFDATSGAFEMPIPTLSAAERGRFLDGDAAFDAVFVSAPAQLNSGVGPVFNQTSCAGCHLRDSRGHASFGAEAPFLGSMLMRLSLPGAGPQGGPVPVPGFGVQLGTRVNFGVTPEAGVSISYFETTEKLSDGAVVYLQHPSYDLVDPYQELPAGVSLSPRMAPPVFGRGLLEAIPEADILALAVSKGPISGRPNYVFNARTGQMELGRFGLKANNPDLLQQTAGAYSEDTGVTSPYFPEESAKGQAQDDGHGDDPEIDQETLEATTFYVSTLAVPARRNPEDPQVLRGEALFASTGCADCHTPTFRTGSHAIAALSNQLIHPYTDLLLHDMGPALADGRPDYEAEDQEWKTPPLWGIGLTETVSGVAAYLHDGRARTLLEAVMFHGGEAEEAREAVRQLSAKDREALLAFLSSL